MWKNPKIVSTLLLNSSTEDIKNNLGDFFVNNFYENIISTNCIENNLLYLITLLLKDEIKNLKNVENSDKFLINTRTGLVLEKLVEKKDIKIYFKTVIIEIIDNLNNYFSNEELTFDKKKLIKNIVKNMKYDNNSLNKGIELFNFKNKNNGIEINHEKENEKKFNKKYVKSLNENDLSLFLSEYAKKTNKNNIQDFINNINNSIKSSPNIYGIKTFSKNISTYTKNMLNLYEYYFSKISSYIDSLLDNLLKNINLLPYQIKCICKIISVLVEKKFPNIQNFQKYLFISKFFFYNIFSLMFLNPGNIALINDFFLTKIQENNLNIIFEIIKKFVDEKLYKDDQIEGKYTPFNWLFIEKMPKLFDFYEKITNVKLPSFIEKLIEDENSEYNYEYFEENKNEIMSHCSICFSIDDLYALIKNIENCKEKIIKENKNSEIDKIVKKILLDEYKNKIYNLKNKKEFQIEEKEDFYEKNSNRTEQKIKKNIYLKENNDFILLNYNKENKKEVLKFFLISNLLINDECKKLNNLNNYKPSNNEKNNIENNENTKIINKVINFLYVILSNYKQLNKEEFYEEKITNFNDILEEIKGNTKLLNSLTDKSIPLNWYISSIIDLLKKLPKEFINNDYENILTKLEKDVNNSINNLNFKLLSLYMDKIQIAKKLIPYYENVLNTIINVKLNLKINYIIKTSNIPIKIIYKKNYNYLKIKPFSEIIESNTSNTSKANKISKRNNTSINLGPNIKETKDEIRIECNTIQEFIDEFPNFSKDCYHKNNNIFNSLEKIHFPEQLISYLQYIKKIISKEKIFKNDKLNLIIQKIYDYIMEQLYIKLFPIEPDDIDNMIYLNCKKVSWIQPEHLFKIENDFMFENFISDITELFEKIQKEKCPRKKFIYLEEIFQCINNLNIFNGLKTDGIDGELPVLHFGMIKAKPQKINSNCEFLKLFLGDKKGKGEESHLTQILLISTQVSKLTNKCFINVSEHEFQEKSKQNLLKFI